MTGNFFMNPTFVSLCNFSCVALLYWSNDNRQTEIGSKVLNLRFHDLRLALLKKVSIVQVSDTTEDE